MLVLPEYLTVFQSLGAWNLWFRSTFQGVGASTKFFLLCSTTLCGCCIQDTSSSSRPTFVLLCVCIFIFRFYYNLNISPSTRWMKILCMGPLGAFPHHSISVSGYISPPKICAVGFGQLMMSGNCEQNVECWMYSLYHVWSELHCFALIWNYGIRATPGRF